MKLIKGIILLIPLLLITLAITHGQASQRITINNTLKSLQLEHAANIAYNNGNDLLAIFLYKQALQLNPNDLKILTDLGGVEFDAGKYVSAISDFKKTLSINHRSQGALLGLGEIVEVMGGTNITSENYFKQVLTVPAITDVEKLDHVISLTHLGNYNGALNIVDLLLKSRPNYTDALVAKGDILLYLKDYTGALTIFNHVLTTHPN